ncbi:phospholipase D1 [Planoprotostelium fungivorum]|uniref:phospholipase D n=1 Tax=Planoprotostelium fungivorum TaxID=1890364 RepID=A0A2P6N1V0_9EUKA|nr:phospholipase D1 [Planoprotostelium fungivorum]
MVVAASSDITVQQPQQSHRITRKIQAVTYTVKGQVYRKKLSRHLDDPEPLEEKEGWPEKKSELLEIQDLQVPIEGALEGVLIEVSKKALRIRHRERYCAVRGGFLEIREVEHCVGFDDRIGRTVQVLALRDAKIMMFRFRGELFWKVITPHKALQFTSSDDNQIRLWASCMSHEANTRSNRFLSFSPVRKNNSLKFLVDSADVCDAIGNAILGARRNIFLSNWCINPEIYLKRSEKTEPHDRLDRLLLEQAERGVKIHVLLWKPTSGGAMGGEFTKLDLESLHPNITVITHPEFLPFEWSHHQKYFIVDEKIAFVGSTDLCFGRWDVTEHPCVDQVAPSLFVGKDYANNNCDNLSQPWKPFQDAVDRTTTPREPWHDVGVRIEGECVQDICYNFIQRWNHHKQTHPQYKLHPFITPDVHREVMVSGQGSSTCQVLRSICEWSGGNYTETSMHQGYLAAIASAEHFIYIENQFFMSSTGGRDMHNLIAQSIIQRISKSIREGKKFFVVVVLPIVPEGFKRGDASVKYLMKLQFDTMWSGEESIYNQLKRLHPEANPADYIRFYGLRSHGYLHSVGAVTEQIYVHAKVMIVDDRIAIVTSANINDRSLMGNRDSELGLLIEDENTITSLMDSRSHVATRFAAGLRRRLWAEHLGFAEDDERLIDPLSSIPLWISTAANNTRTFSEVFRNIPGDHIRTLKEFDQLDETYDGARHSERLESIRGHLVEFPLQFLVDDHDHLKPAGRVHHIRKFDKVFQ